MSRASNNQGEKQKERHEKPLYVSSHQLPYAEAFYGQALLSVGKCKLI